MGLEAHQSAPCPYCGATWNEPGAQFCTKCHLQLPPPAFVRPGLPDPETIQRPAPIQVISDGATTIRPEPPVAPAATAATWRVAYRKQILLGGGFLAVLGTLGALIAMAQATASSESQTLNAVIAQQPTVDAAITEFLSAAPIEQASGLDAVRAESDRGLNQYRHALTTVQKQEAALQQARSTLTLLGPLSLGNGPASMLDNRAADALSGLAQADQVLAAAIDQETIGRAVFETVLKEQQMLDAIKQQQYMLADRIDADADHALLPADWRRHYNDVPPQMDLLVGTVGAMIINTDSVAMYTFRSQTGPLAFAQSEVQSTIAEYNNLSGATVMAQNAAWNASRYQPKMDTYDTALSKLKSR